MPGAFPSGSSSHSAQGSSSSPTTSHSTSKFEVDQTKPTTSVQIRLADGTRIVCRMNLTHTVGDIRNFINASVFHCKLSTVMIDGLIVHDLRI